MVKKEKKIQPLRIYLLKRSCNSYKMAIRSNLNLKEFTLNSIPGIDGTFFLRPAVRSTPDWAKFIQTGVKDKLPKIESIANAGVLFLRIDSDIVAIVFGTGRYLLKDSCYETDFGLRSTLNAVDPTTMDQIEVNWFGEMVVQKKTQVSQKAGLAAFEIDVNRERFRSLAGKSKNKKLGGRINGSEGGFGVHARIDFKELADQCRECIKAYRCKDYQKAFPRYDDFSIVTDAAKLDSLDQKLLARLRKKDSTGTHLSAPAIIAYEDFAGYSFSPKGDIFSDMQIEQYFATNKDFASLKLENLKSHRVYLRSTNQEEPLAQWSIYRCTICEISEGSTIFVLWDGKWFRIAKKFAEKIRNEIQSIPIAATSLPSKTAFKLEAEFLKDCAAKNSDLALMDQQNVWCDNAGSEMEVCDLFSESRQFIHVKRRSHGSSGLSHLFAQGRNSAEAFLKDDSFRAGAKSQLQLVASKFSRKIPKARPKPEEFEVVYVVMGKKRGKFVNELPFFSQLTLYREAKDLRTLGFKVSFQFVEAPE